jgi:hypothetical protein
MLNTTSSSPGPRYERGSATHLRLILANGDWGADNYDPVPIARGATTPPMADWASKHGASDEAIVRLGESWPHATDTAIITRRTPAIVIGLTDPTAAEAVEKLVRKHFEIEEESEHCELKGPPPRILVRRTPQLAIVLRTDTPFRSFHVDLIAPNGERERIEVLGDGAQILAFGDPREENSLCDWPDGSPTTVDRGELPPTDGDGLRRFVEEDIADLVIAEHGYIWPPDQPRRSEAERFLAALDPKATSFTFQFFAEDRGSTDQSLAGFVHGSLAQYWDKLVRLNARGSGVFVTVNASDFNGRSTENIVRVRALFTDLDGAPLEPVTSCNPPPHIITLSSPGRWHCYWISADPPPDPDAPGDHIPLDQLRGLQKALAERFDGDKSVHDLPRVLRMPGFVHRKSTPFLTRLVHVDRSRKPYTFKELTAAFPPAPKPEPRPEPPQIETGTDYRRGAAWAKVALDASVRELANAAKDTRHAVLLAKANRLATMIARGWIDSREVRRALFAAAEANGQVAQYGATDINRIISDGIAHSIGLPHPDLPNDDSASSRGASNNPGENHASPPIIEEHAGKTITAHTPTLGEVLHDGGGIPPGALPGIAQEIPDDEEHPPEGVALEDFNAYMPLHTYIYSPTREPWPAASVNARIPPIPLFEPDGTPILNNKGEQATQKAAAWLDENRPVEQMTWCPGLPMIIANRLVADGGWIERDGVSCFNLYRPPAIRSTQGRANAASVQPWLSHVHRLYEKDTAFHIIEWNAHRVQRPQERINHAIVLGGWQGIGKDTMLEPVKHAVGPWNFQEVSPQQLTGRFNSFVKSVILRVSEARDLGDVNRFTFYDHMKVYTAAPPDVLRVDEKNLREHAVFNCCGVIITSNYKNDSIYLPADDRRHFVTWSNLTKEEFTQEYWDNLWNWYANGGIAAVATYLASLDISGFNPKAPPPKTEAFWAIVDASRAPEDAELADVIEALDNPDAVTLKQIMEKAAATPATTMGFDENTTQAKNSFEAWIKDRRNRRQIPHRMEQCRYVPVRNDAAKDGLWVIGGSRQVVYAKTELSLHNQIKAARQL